MGKKVLVIPDTHFPWCNYKKLASVYSIVQREKPDIVIQIGDIFDFYSHSKFAKSHNLCTPNEEILEARKAAENMWLNVKKSSPKSECIQFKGNHDARVEKRIYEKYPEIASLVDLNHLWRFPGVHTLESDKDTLEIYGVVYLHGFLTGAGAPHMKYFNKSVIHGHDHRAWLIFEKCFDKSIKFEMSCGHLAEEESLPLQYGMTKHTKWVQGCGLIDGYGPRFIIL